MLDSGIDGVDSDGSEFILNALSVQPSEQNESSLACLIIADFAKQSPALVSSKLIAEARIRVLTTKVSERVAKYRGLSAVVVSDEDLQREGMSIEASLEWARNAVACGVAESVVLTLGRSGCLLIRADRVSKIAAVQSPVHNATGAGDTFVAGLAKSLLSGINIDSACRLASRLASRSVGNLATGVGSDLNMKERNLI